MSTPDPDAPTTAQLSELEAKYRAEIEELQARHIAAINHLRSSLSYRIGDTIVGLRSKSGRRQFPSQLWKIITEIRHRRQPFSSMRSDWSEIVPRDSRRVLSILDEFSHACLAPEVSLESLNRRYQADQLSDAAFLFAETAWRGNEGEWSYAFSRFEEDSDLRSLLSDSRRAGLTTILWNKEDPVNYETFLPAARSFDVVLTTDEGSLDRYRTDLGHDRVAACAFAAQPLIHNPIGRQGGTTRSVCFAGAWRGHKYPERARDLELLLDAASEVTELRIFDREPRRGAPGESFPERFHKAIVGTLPYRKMVDEYHRHACFLNVNSVTGSPTMLSRRVFELLACRTPVVSSPSLALERLFGELVPTPRNLDEATDVIGRIVEDVDYRDRLGQAGYRAVMSKHTYQHRLGELADVLRTERFSAPLEPSIDVICVSRRPDYLERALNNFRRQNYARIHLVFVTNGEEFDRHTVESAIRSIPGAELLHFPDEVSLGECLNAARDICQGDYFAKFDDDDTYGEHYLSDLILAARFADASIFGKRSFHAHVESKDVTVIRHEGHEFAYSDFVMGGTILARHDDVKSIPFRPLAFGSDTQFLKECRDSGLKIFSTDRFNYLMSRREGAGQHTWTISDREFLATSRQLGSGSLSHQVMI